MSFEKHEILKIQIGGLYLEIVIDGKALENIEYVKDLLIFLEDRLLKKQEKEEKKHRI